MLQIVTGRYFRSDVPMHSTEHRTVLYTNRWFLDMPEVALPLATLRPATPIGMQSVMLVLTEHLEASDLDGSDSSLISTGGTELVDDYADLLSFGLNSTFSRNHALVDRLVPARSGADGRRYDTAAGLFSRTFDPTILITDDELDELRALIERLLDLERDAFEKAMRAIRRVVRATRRAADEPTIAYTDLVAAIESLAVNDEAPPDWARVDPRKKKIINAALEGIEADAAERIRAAVATADKAGAKQRFLEFVHATIAPSYFRTEAAGLTRPISGSKFGRALKHAYDIRSTSVHRLSELPAEAVALGARADSVVLPTGETLMSLEGLARLARHVITRYVYAAPSSNDEAFDWRASLPGQLQMTLSPEYWIHQADGFTHAMAPRYLEGFVEHLINLSRATDQPIADMRSVLEKIEQMLPGTSDGEAREAMLAIYEIWHRVVAPELARPGFEEFLTDADDAGVLNIPRFAVYVLVGSSQDWDLDQWLELARGRREWRRTSKGGMPTVIEAAIHVVCANLLLEQSRIAEATTSAGHAIDEYPGHPDLIAWEAALVEASAAPLDVRALVYGRSEPEEPEESPGKSEVESSS